MILKRHLQAETSPVEKPTTVDEAREKYRKMLEADSPDFANQSPTSPGEKSVRFVTI